jgi:hypothetical protein
MEKEEYFLSSEKAFKTFLNTLCCNQCMFFINKKCVETNAEEHEKDKIELKNACEQTYYDGWKATPEPISDARRKMLNYNLEMSKNIDDHFLCDKYENKKSHN